MKKVLTISYFSLHTLPLMAQKNPAVIQHGISESPPTYSPTHCTSTACSEILQHTHEGLYGTVDFQPYLAVISHKVSADRLTHTFEVGNSKWDDGSPVTAEDYVSGIRLFADPATASDMSDLAIQAKILNADCVVARKCPVKNLGVRAIDAKTVEIKLRVPNDDLPHYLANVTMSPVRVRNKFPDGYGTKPTDIPCNGPFKLVAPAEGEFHYALVPNPNYAGPLKRGNITRISPTFESRDHMALVNAFLTGKINVFGYSRAEIASMINENKDRMGLVVTPVKEPSLFFLGLNMRNPAFKDADIREMIFNAIDRNAIVKAMNGSLTLYDHIIPEMFQAFRGKTFGQVIKYPPTQYSLARAKALKTQIMANKQKAQLMPKSISFYISDSSVSKIFGETIQASIQSAIGLKVNLVVSDYKTWLTNRTKSDLMRIGWMADVPIASNFLQLFYTGATFNDSAVSLKSYDSLVNMAEEMPPEVRTPLQIAAEQILLTGHYIMPLGMSLGFRTHNKKFSGFYPGGDFRQVVYKE